MDQHRQKKIGVTAEPGVHAVEVVEVAAGAGMKPEGSKYPFLKPGTHMNHMNFLDQEKWLPFHPKSYRCR